MVDSIRELREEIPLALRVARMRMAAQAHYRASFALQMLGNTVLTILEIVALAIFFHRFPALGGWTLDEVLLLYAVSAISFEIADTIQNGLDLVPTYVRSGDFDALMTRPMSLYLQAMLLEVSVRHIGKLALAVGLFIYAWVRVDPAVTGGELLMFSIAILCAIALFVAIFSLGAIVSFWTVGSIEMVNAISYGGSDLAQYPIHIYRAWFRWVFLWVIPVGMVIYYPTLNLLDKPDPLGLGSVAPALGPLLTVAFVVAIGWLWNRAVAHYHSTGS
jgi:ABC-2 type transport system permease protein